MNKPIAAVLKISAIAALILLLFLLLRPGVVDSPVMPVPPQATSTDEVIPVTRSQSTETEEQAVITETATTMPTKMDVPPLAEKPSPKPPASATPIEKPKSLVQKIQTTLQGIYTPGNDGNGDLSLPGVVYYTNISRQAEGFAPLSSDFELGKAAQLKLADMFANQYFAHESPSGLGPSDFVDLTAYEYVSVAENIAMGGFEGDEDLVNKWMESPGHRANILNPQLTDLGVAVGEGMLDGQRVWLAVQTFGRPLSACPPIDTDAEAQIADLRNTIASFELELADTRTVIESMQAPQNEAEYQVQVSIVNAYNDSVAQYESLIADINALISRYNGSVDAFNVCVSES